MKLLSYGHQLYLVVVKRFGMEPMMVLTSCAVKPYQKESVWRVGEYYLAHWKWDKSYRYINQCYPLEDIRVEVISVFGIW